MEFQLICSYKVYMNKDVSTHVASLNVSTDSSMLFR